MIWRKKSRWLNLATIVSKVKGYVSFFPSHRAERKWKKAIADTTSVYRKSQKSATQPSPMFVCTSYQPRQNLQPLATTHPDYNLFKTSRILPTITYPLQPKPESQAKPQNKLSPSKKDKEPLYQPPDPIIGASSKPPDMNMLVVDPNPPNPISSFLKNLTLEDPKSPFKLPVIAYID